MVQRNSGTQAATGCGKSPFLELQSGLGSGSMLHNVINEEPHLAMEALLSMRGLFPEAAVRQLVRLVSNPIITVASL